jgi:HlyD family secretion protein
MAEEVAVIVGEYVDSGALLAVLSSDSASDSLRDSAMALREAELTWENATKQMENYSLTSPISGSIISKSVKAGDTLEAGSKTIMAVIADMSLMSFTINVDELDIAKIQRGQRASITVDALSGRIFSGAVDNVGILGTTSNGVTTYPVRIVFDEAEGLWPGMNATAVIVVNSVSDVLVIPVGAVNRGNTVLVKGAAEPGGEIDRSDAPEGTHYVAVELGLNNDNFIEVSNGLEEGQIVMVAVSAEEELMQQNTMMFGPGMGGAMPAGGGMVVRGAGGGGAPGGARPGAPSGGSGGSGGNPGGGAGGQ